jgi:hypothetical protein
MRTLDRYDYIGITLISLLAVVWVLHFVLPAPPPEPPVPGIAPPSSPFPR